MDCLCSQTDKYTNVYFIENRFASMSSSYNNRIARSIPTQLNGAAGVTLEVGKFAII